MPASPGSRGPRPDIDARRVTVPHARPARNASISIGKTVSFIPPGFPQKAGGQAITETPPHKPFSKCHFHTGMAVREAESLVESDRVISLQVGGKLNQCGAV